MATGFYNNLKGKAGNLGSSLAKALFGSTEIVPLQDDENTSKYPAGIQNYLDSLENQPYMQKLLDQPKETRLTPDQYKEGIAQGLNYGVPEIADAQKELKINIPKTDEEIELAKVGEFNQYPFRAGLTGTHKTNGFFDDLTSGYRENYNESFKPQNLVPQNKNWATRIGEGLGSVGRFIDSPLGRGLLAAGINSALGYDDSAIEGLQAYVGRKNSQTEDKLYRNSLMNDYGMTQEELDSIGGQITKDLYNTIAANRYKRESLQVKRDIAGATDNTKRANLIMSGLKSGMITPEEAQQQMEKYGVTLKDLQESNETKILPQKQYALITAPQVAMGNYNLSQAKFNHQIAQDNFDNWIQTQKLNNEKAEKTEKLSASQKDAKSTLGQINNIRNLVNSNPNAVGLQKGYLPGDVVNRLDSKAENIKTRTAIDALKTKVRHDLTGAQFSPKEAKEYEKFLPTNKDNAQIINAKLDALEQRYYADFGVSLTGQTQPQQNSGGWAF